MTQGQSQAGTAGLSRGNGSTPPGGEPGPGRRRPRGVDVRLQVARAVALSASALSRSTGRGAGTSIGGRVALALVPDALARMGNGRVLACVTGTNGKTTATRLLATAIRSHRPVVSNDSGANLPNGLVGALSAAPPDRGAVLEVDELHLAAALRALKPRVVVLLNLSRDQLDRTAETQRPAALWRECLSAAAQQPAPVVIANCDDPRVSWAASGGGRVVWVAPGQTWTGDSLVCPGCGNPLRHERLGSLRGSAGWRCSGCGLARPEPGFTLIGDRLVLPDGTSTRIRLELPGRANLANAALAAAAAAELGVGVQPALAAMASVREIEGRYGERDIDGHRCRLLLAKNPAGWAEILDLLDGDGCRPLLLSVNAGPVDGRDTSWLYDVPFERLGERRVVVTGAAAPDLAMRLGYAGVQHQVVLDPRRAVAVAAEGDGRLDAIGDYSGFQRLRALGAAPGGLG